MLTIQFWLILLAAVTPAFFLLAYILIKDYKHPEPFPMIAKGFGYGCLSVLVVLLVVGLPAHYGLLNFNFTPVWNAIANAFLTAAFPEEAAKMLMLWLLLRHNPYYDERMDGIVYAACVGMGFAATENITYLFSNIEMWQNVAIGRAFMAIPEHFCLAVIMGYFFSIATFKPGKKWCFVLAYLIPVLVHGTYDACLMIQEIPEMSSNIVVSTLFLCSFVFAIWYSQKAIKRNQAADDIKTIGNKFLKR